MTDYQQAFGDLRADLTNLAERLKETGDPCGSGCTPGAEILVRELLDASAMDAEAVEEEARYADRVGSDFERVAAKQGQILSEIASVIGGPNYHHDLPERARVALDKARAEAKRLTAQWNRAHHNEGVWRAEVENLRKQAEERGDELDSWRTEVLARAEVAESVLAAVWALLDLPYGADNWGLLHDGVRYIQAPTLLVALTTTDEGDLS